MAKQKEVGVSVDNVDVLSAALDAAMKRIQDMEPSMGSTLVCQISKEDWANWDASQEKVIVSDTAGLDEEEPLDEVHPQAA